MFLHSTLMKRLLILSLLLTACAAGTDRAPPVEEPQKAPAVEVPTPKPIPTPASSAAPTPTSSEAPAPIPTSSAAPAPAPTPEPEPEPEPTPTPTPTPSKPRMIMLHTSNWAFSPNSIVLKKGEDVSVHLMGMEGNHGIAIPGLGINERMDQGSIKMVKIPTDKTGTFEFFCNTQCGVGHSDMQGTIIIIE